MKNLPLIHRLLPSLALAVLALVPGVRAQTLTPAVIYNFSRTTRYDVDALGALVQDAAGNFYGTTQGGGDFGYGSVYRFTAAGTFTTLYSFSGSDGSTPSSELLLYSDGNLYGTTLDGGSFDFGTVFRLTPGGVLTTLHSFLKADGRAPRGGLATGADGNLYGTTTEGGTANTGTVFVITPAGTLTTLHSFVRGEGTAPQASLVRGTDGNFYGTTAFNGSTDQRNVGPGSIFRITPAGSFQVLHLFNPNVDGFDPIAGLVQGSDGAFYGVNPDGGANGTGTIFRVTADGVFSVIYTFSYPDGGGFNGDGIAPTGTLLNGGNGLLYGNTSLGGLDGSGTVFSVTPTGAFTVLYDFTYLFNDGTNADGAEPIAGFVRGADGRLYAPTTAGGANAEGTIVAFALNGSTTASFFTGQVSLGNGVYYLALPDGNLFGYYSYLSDPNYLYHFDLGYEYVFNADDSQGGVYLYDFKSGHFFYTSPTFPFPYLYDFSLNAVLYYYPNPQVAGHYTSNPRYFYNFGTGAIINQ